MNARRIALQVLTEVIQNQSYLNLTLKSAFPSQTSPEDKRFVTALVNTTLENLLRIDYVLRQFVQTKRVHTVVQNILRLGACQLMFFEHVPASAAVNESVKLVQSVGKAQLKGFVNATLRNLSGNLGKLHYPDRNADTAEFFSIFYSYPKWLCEQYIRDYGAKQTEELLSYQPDFARVCVRIADASAFSADEPGQYYEDAGYLKNAAGVERLPAFVSGAITVQGEASMLCVRAAGVQSEDRVLDVCAAPGGKSAYFAQFAKEVVGVELHEHRCGLMRANFERLHVKNVSIVQADATQEHADWAERFDVVAVDAPCSALGLAYRKPDIKLFKTREDVEQLSALQQQILNVSSRYVKPGGTLMYSTCTMNKQENEDNVHRFLQEHPQFECAPLILPQAFKQYERDGMIQLFASRDGIDGFFVARMKRK